MADVRVPPKYGELASGWIGFLKESGVHLTKPAEVLFVVAIEGWFEDRLPELRERNYDEMVNLLDETVRASVYEVHVARRRKAGEEVSLAEWLYALGEKGREVLKTIITKGF